MILDLLVTYLFLNDKINKDCLPTFKIDVDFLFYLYKNVCFLQRNCKICRPASGSGTSGGPRPNRSTSLRLGLYYFSWSMVVITFITVNGHCQQEKISCKKN